MQTLETNMMIGRLRQLPKPVRVALPAVILGLQVVDLVLRVTPVEQMLLAPIGILLTSLLQPIYPVLALTAAMAGIAGLDHYWQYHDFTFSAPIPMIIHVSLYVIPWLCASWLLNTVMDKVDFLLAIARDTGELIYLIKPDGTIAYVNEAGARALGYQRDELIGKPAERLAPAWFEREANQRLAATVGQLKRMHSLIHILHRSGEERIYRVRSQPFHLQNRIYLLGVAQNVTEPLLNEWLVEATFDALDTPTAVRTPDGRMISCNQAFADAVGKPKETLTGTTISPYGLPAEQTQLGPQEIALLDAGQKVEKELQAGDRTLRWCCFPVRNERGALIATLTVTRDITAAKQSEARMVQAAKLAAVGQVAAGVAHNINNLLTAVAVNAELLKLQPEGMGPRAVEGILAAVDQGSAMVRKLYGFTGSSDNPQTERLAVTEIFQGVIQVLQPQLLRCGIRVRVAAADGVFVYGDANLLNQVLMNLAINALQAMPCGGDLSFACEQEAGMAGLQVRDTGCGIPAANLEKLFIPFFTTKNQADGTGLGLSTSLGMVRSMGGEIRVWSQVGVGSSFTVLLPGGVGA